MRQLKITKQITQRTDESINRYFQEINKYEMISLEEEIELSVKIRKGDDAALERLVLANLRFVISVAKQYQNQGLSFPDLINEGNVGLVKAAKKFDETRGFKFISYAVWWIRQSIIQAISEQTRVVRLPLNRITTINKINKAIPYLEQNYQREPTNDEIADYLDISIEEVTAAKDINKRQFSFDMPISTEGNNEITLYDFVQTENMPSPDTQLVKESTSINIDRALTKLSRREATILIMTYGLNGTPVHSLHDIAVKYDMSSERIRQIRSRGLSKLKSLIGNKYEFLEF
ncbi:MAG: RNA polymerase sigma factor RpoD/SigA [Bacteroidales bacterium]|nr:RNA polymerase sigma factor RpoD/SigA [Bacteroidales bacterium]